MIHETLVYHVATLKCLGALYTQEKTTRPLVLVAHAWRGQDEFAREQAKALAEKGYAALALDLYGDGTSVTTNEEAEALMLPLFMNRKELRKRMIAAFEAVSALSWVDKARIAAIGFCFGGLAALELLRAGAPLKGVVTIHGLLGYRLGDHIASKEPLQPIRGSLLVLHGAADPMVPWSDLQELDKEMTQAGADWEIDIYGHAVHAFSNPEVHDKKGGLAYDAKTAKKAYQRMDSFFKELFK
jgi:dienelactone hydrolase